VHVAALPDKDPDALVQAGRGAELSRALQDAPAVLDAAIAKATNAATGSVQARMAAVDDLLPILAAPGDGAVRNIAVKVAARALGDDEGELGKRVADRGSMLLQRDLGQTRKQVPPPVAEPAATAPVKSARPPTRTVWPEVEILLARALLCHPGLAPQALPLREHVKTRELAQFIDRLLDALVRFHDEDPQLVLTKVQVERTGDLIRIADDIRLRGGAARFMTELHAASLVAEAVVALVDKGALQQKLQDVQKTLASAIDANDPARIQRLLMEQRVVVDAIRALDGESSALTPPTNTSPRTLAAANAPVALALPPAPMDAPSTPHRSMDTVAAPPPADASDDDDNAADLPWAGGPDEDPWSA
jgi:hypothetical protein